MSSSMMQNPSDPEACACKVILQSQGKEFFTWHGKDFFT